LEHANISITKCGHIKTHKKREEYYTKCQAPGQWTSMRFFIFLHQNKII